MSTINRQIRRLEGALRSKHPAARLGILIKALSPFTNTFDTIIYTALNLKKETNLQIPPCMMIVSPPRAGGTIIYQVLTRIIPCVYISNLHRLLPNLASSYMYKTGKFAQNLYGYNNYYGYTTNLYDVNEGNEIIDKLFKESKNKESIRRNFINFVISMKADADQPLLYKNVKNYDKILDLHQAVPELIFLRIRRNIEQIMQSELKAHYELGTFNPIPDFLTDTPFSDPVDFCVRQILGIEKKIDDQKKRISSINWVEWSYEDFCTNTLAMIRDLAKNYLGIEANRLREKMLNEPLRLSNSNKVSDSDIARIQHLLKKYKGNPLV